MGLRRRFDDRFVAIVTVPGADGHTHCALVDDNGNGQTSEAPDGHFHLVEELVVRFTMRHTHELSATRCEGRHNAKANHVIPRRAPVPSPRAAGDGAVEIDPRAPRAVEVGKRAALARR